MKLTKRILVAILALALLASMLVFSAFAEDDGFRNVGMDAPEDILEYYQYEDYLADNYDDGTWTEEYMSIDADYDHSSSQYANYPYISVGPSSNPAPNEDNATDVLAVSLPRGLDSGYEMQSEDKSVLTQSLLLTFDIYFDESCENKLIYDLKVGTVKLNARGKLQASSSKSTILGVNFLDGDLNITKDENGDNLEESVTNSGPAFYYSTWNNATSQFRGANSQKIVEGITPEYGKWYEVLICVDTLNDQYYFTISDGETTFESEKLSMAGCEGIWGFQCLGKYQSDNALNNDDASKAATADYYLDNVEIYEGTYRRYPSYKSEYTKVHLEDLENYYLNNRDNIDERIRVAEVLDYLYNKCDETEFTPELRNTLPNAYAYINETYTEGLVAEVANIDTTASYGDRLAHLDDIAKYNDSLPANEELENALGITADRKKSIEDARALYANEIAELETIKLHSDNFIACMEAQYESTMAANTYEALTALLAEISGEGYAKRDVTYEGVAELEAIYDVFEETVSTMKKDVDTFVNAVAEMEAAQTFGPRYLAYAVARNYYNQYGTPGLINPNFDQDAYTPVVEKIAVYEANSAEIERKSAENSSFNNIVREASMATSYNSILNRLDAAAEFYPLIEADYPGISDSVATYNSLKAAVDDSERAAAAYIAAVNEIANAKDFYSKKEAVEKAKALKALGNVVGYEGVKEANEAFVAAEADVNVLEGNSTTLISLVAQIAEATTLAERRELIRLAQQFVDSSEATYEGVAEAKAALAAAIEAFEADVVAANAALASATSNAQAVVSSVGSSYIFVAQAE